MTEIKFTGVNTECMKELLLKILKCIRIHSKFLLCNSFIRNYIEVLLDIPMTTEKEVIFKIKNYLDLYFEVLGV